MKAAARRQTLAPLAVSLFLAYPEAHAGLAPGVLPLINDYGEIREHLIGENPRVTTAWFDITTDRDSPSWKFDLVIDENGAVKSARFADGDVEYRREAQLAAESTRFKPFLRDGKPTAVSLELDVWSRPADYAGPADRVFPTTVDPSNAVIALARTQCLGTCPDYRVEIRGNGEVRYEGNMHVIVPGKLRWRIDPASLAPLFERFRNANYFELAGSYVAPVTDLPGYTTRLSLGAQHKTVYDYGGGGGIGETMASTRMPGDPPEMPEAVTQIEDAIDQVSGVSSFVSGDAATLEKLRARHWNFRSTDAGNAVRKLLTDCKTAVARGFIEAGAPVDNAGNERDFDTGMPIAYATHCADLDLVRLMLEKGALKKPADAKNFLWSSVASGDPRMVALALKRYPKVNEKSEDGAPLLSSAAGSFVREDGAPNAAFFDSAKVVEMLVDAGADPNARDGDGRTPLFEANEAAVAAALLRRGADPNMRDELGQTALFDHYFAEPKRVLVAAGADVNARDKEGRTALFFQTDADAVRILHDAGAKLELADSKGRTAVEQMNSSSVTAALLAAGAKLPPDPVRRQAMIDEATKHKWTELLPLLRNPPPSH